MPIRPEWRGVTLDYFIRCEVAGCETKVLSLTGLMHIRCQTHGGPIVPNLTDEPVAALPGHAVPLSE